MTRLPMPRGGGISQVWGYNSWYFGVVLPWGKYLYLRLPMGIAGSPDFFQEKMSSLMQTLTYIKVYLDDLLVITKSKYEDHLKKLQVVLSRLQNTGICLPGMSV